MEQTIRRPKVARAYAWLIVLVPLAVIVQGILFAGFYSEAEGDLLDAHGVVGDILGIVILVILTPLAFLARFPRRLSMGWWSLGLAVVWNIQSHVFGRGIEDVGWFEMLHVPLALIIFGLGLYLTWYAHRALAGRPD